MEAYVIFGYMIRNTFYQHGIGWVSISIIFPPSIPSVNIDNFISIYEDSVITKRKLAIPLVIVARIRAGAVTHN